MDLDVEVWDELDGVDAEKMEGAKDALSALRCLELLLDAERPVKPLREPRTRSASLWHDLYSRMRPEEFRRTFRLPRSLFDSIAEDLRPQIQARFVRRSLP